MRPLALTFEEQGHVYRVNGFRVPSVTQCLLEINDLSFVDPVRLEAAREFGTHVHMMVDLYNRTLLDVARLDGALTPYLSGYQKFLDDTRFRVVASEEQIFHPMLRYAGTLDLRGTMNDATWLIDVKSGDYIPGCVGAQTAAYREALAAGGIGKPRFRGCLQLLPNAYQFHELRDRSDWPMFVSCLNVHRYNKRRLYDR